MRSCHPDYPPIEENVYTTNVVTYATFNSCLKSGELKTSENGLIVIGIELEQIVSLRSIFFVEANKSNKHNNWLDEVWTDSDGLESSRDGTQYHA